MIVFSIFIDGAVCAAIHSFRHVIPVSHILDDHGMSENDCVRISIKTSAKNEEIRNKIEQESRYGQLKLV